MDEDGGVRELNLKVRGSLFSLDLSHLTQLQDVCKLVKIAEQDIIEGKGKMAVTQMSPLDDEQMPEDGGLATFGAVEDLITFFQTDDSSPSTTSPTKEL